MKENRYIHSVRKFFLGTFFSRCSGMLRDMLLAFYFGATPFLAHFFVAYRFVYLFRRLFGEGGVQPGFVPHFNQIKEEDEQKAHHFYRDILLSLTLLLSIGIIIAEIVLFFFKDNPVVFLSMILLPAILFLFLYVIQSAFLQCYGSFFTSSVAPALFNAFWIGSIVVASYFATERSSIILSIGIVFGFFVQMLLPFLRSRLFIKLKWKDFYRARLFSPECKKLFLSLFYIIVGVGATQINTAIDALFAQIAHPSGPAYLWYAIRLQQLPLALFGLAFSGAILPKLTSLLACDDRKGYTDLISRSAVQLSSLIVPSSLFLFLLGPYLIHFLFGRGQFLYSDLVETTHCLWGYLLGLFPMTLVLIFSSALYAKKKYQKMMGISLFTVLVNICINSFFLFVLQLGAKSIAYATSITSYLQLLLLIKALQERDIFQRGKEFGKVIAVAFAAAAIVMIPLHFFEGKNFLLDFSIPGQEYFSTRFIGQIIGIIVPGILFAGIYTLLSIVLRIDLFLALIYHPKKLGSVR